MWVCESAYVMCVFLCVWGIVHKWSDCGCLCVCVLVCLQVCVYVYSTNQPGVCRDTGESNPTKVGVRSQPQQHKLSLGSSWSLCSFCSANEAFVVTPAKAIPHWWPVYVNILMCGRKSEHFPLNSKGTAGSFVLRPEAGWLTVQLGRNGRMHF